MLEKRPIKNVHIYVLKDPETLEVRYVGKTKRTLKQRLSVHLCQKKDTYKDRWINSLKNKNLTPIIESIELVSDDTWEEREIYWIHFYKNSNARLTNANGGGLGCYKPTTETRTKMSAASKRKIYSAESRAKMSASRKGKKLSTETRAKMSAAAKGKKRSTETRAKMSAASKRRTYSAETRAKMSAAAKRMSAESRAKIAAANRNPSAETRAKIGAAHKGKKLSAEAIAKRTAARKANRELQLKASGDNGTG